MAKTRSQHRYNKYVKTLGGALVKGYKIYRKGKAIKDFHEKLVKLRNRRRALRGPDRYKLNARRYVGHDSEKAATERSFTRMLHKPRKLFKTVGTWTYYQQQYGSLANVEGQQAGALVTAHWTSDQFVLNSGVGANVIQFATCIFDMNPYQAITNVTQYALAPAAPLDDQVHCKSVISDLQITNLSTLATQIVLYWFVNKVHTANNVFPEWQACLTSEALGQTAVAPPASFVAPAVLGYPDQSCYGTTPMSCHAFRKQFRVIKKVEFMLDGAATEKIKYRIGLNKSFSRRAMQEANGSSQHFYNGASVQLLMIMRPTPVMVTEGTAPPVDVGVTIGNAKVGYTINSKYTFTTIPGIRTSVNRALQSFVHDAVGTEKIINVVDTVATNVQA